MSDGGLGHLIRKGTISNKDATIAGIASGALVLLLLIYIVGVQRTLIKQTDELNAVVKVKASELKRGKRTRREERRTTRETSPSSAVTRGRC